MRRLLPAVLSGLVLAAAFALGWTKTDDTDAWFHLALGREIVHKGGFPAHEPLSYPTLGLPFYDSEWLFDVLLYLAHLAGGFAGVTLLKAFAATLALAILWADAMTPRRSGPLQGAQAPLAAAVLGPTVLIVAYRFVERPDLLVMIFLPLTIYALNQYVYASRPGWLYALPFLQVVWINTHPSAVLAAVPFAAALVGGGLQRLLRHRGWDGAGTPDVRQLKTIGLVGCAVAGACLVNPYGYRPLLLPLELVQSGYLNREINELQAPLVRDFPVIFGMAVVLVLSFAAARSRVSLVSVLLAGPFLYKGLTGIRFVFLLGLVAAPIIVRNILDALEPIAEGRGRIPILAGAHVAAGAGLVFTLLGAIHVVPLLDPRRAPGFGVHDAFVPEGALRYLDRTEIAGRIYNPFHLGGYIEWRDFPRRSAIIDGRGYVPPGMLEEIHFARAYVEHLERLRATYGFDVAVVDYPAHTKLLLEEMPDNLDLGLIAPGWALVYWDDVALVYLRRTEKFAPVIARDEYRHLKPANGPGFLMRALETGDEPTRAAIARELHRNIAETRSSIGSTLLGYAALHNGDLEASVRAFGQVRDLKFVPQATLGLAMAHWRRGDVAGSLAAYRKRLALGEDARLFFSVGVALVQLGRPREAVPYLEQARRLGPDFPPVYPALLDAYQRAGLPPGEQALASGHADALARANAEDHMRRARLHQRDGRLDEAMGELKAALTVLPSSADATSQLGYVYLFLGRLDDAIAQQRAALRLDSQLPKAHYGLALAYQRLGDDPRAREHFSTYARLEPRTYQAWRIREGFPLPGPPASK